VSKLRLSGLCLATLLLSAQAGSARVERKTVRKTANPIWTLAIDGSRVAYSSGGLIHVWDLATGKTSTVKGKYANALHTANASQLAIAGKRVAWIKDQGFGNTEEGEKLYIASVGGRAHQLMHVYRYGADDSTHTTGGWIEGLVGSGKSLAVSTWRSDGTTAKDRQLSLVTRDGLEPLAGGSGSIVAQAIDGDHVVDLQSGPWSASTSVSIYSTSGDPLNELSLDAAEKVALTGNQLAVLTPAPTPTIEVYDWTTGTLEHTWLAQGAATATTGPNQVAHVEAYGGLVLYSVYGQYVGGDETLHVLDPATGKDVVVTKVKAFGANREWAIGSRGLVYAVNSGNYTRSSSSGKLVFVSTAKLEALLGQ
jgi:WD40 repeat protein